MYSNSYGNDNYYGDYDRKLLDLLTEAMLDEKKDYRKYRTMAEMTDNNGIIEQMRYVYEDEAKHYEMFQEQENSNKFIDAIKSSINGELAAVELYREIRAMLRGRKYRDILYEIIIDKQEHATRFVYLYSMLK